MPSLKRLAAILPLLLLISFFAFLLVRLAPGGPFDRERKPASPEIERALKSKYHLDEPLMKQYARYLGLLWRRTPAGSGVMSRPASTFPCAIGTIGFPTS